MKKVLIAGVMSVIFVPTFVFAATMGRRTYVGHGMVEGVGAGSMSFDGEGLMNMEGEGVLSFSKNAQVELHGRMGIRTETDKLITYTGFKGNASISGEDVYGSFSGNIDHFIVGGEGRMDLAGNGKVNAERWENVRTMVKTMSR